MIQLNIHRVDSKKVVHVQQSEKNKSVILRQCRVCSVHKRRKETCFMYLTCVCHFVKQHVSENITQKITDKLSKNLIPDMAHNISFKKLWWIIICFDINKSFCATCILYLYSIKGMRVWVKFNCPSVREGFSMYRFTLLAILWYACYVKGPARVASLFL